MLRRPAAMRAMPAPRIATPMRARKPLNEAAVPATPLPVLGAIGVLRAPGPGVFSPATMSVFGVALGSTVFFGSSVVTGVGGTTGVVPGVGVVRMSGLQLLVQTGICGILVFITQTLSLIHI